MTIMFTGCSFKADTPAPVVSINSPVKKAYKRGGLTSDHYKVKKGDTLYSISWAANKDFVDIARRNGLKKPYTIYPGQVLKLNSTRSVTNKLSVKNTPKVVASTGNSFKKQSVDDVSVPKKQKVAPSKKQLDHGQNSAYSVTSDQQIVNGVIHKPKSNLPPKVYRWFWPVKGKLIGKFSANEQGNKGIKIAGSRGDRIQAAADGRVVYAGNALRGYGNLVIIKHSDDYLSAYAHADKILVKEKQFVTAGQTVASMGQTGTNRVMLHFEIRYHGKSVDPLKYLPKI
ncbi:peptidoglycan DD-metalloendopeptidase family protein [Shewanella psychrotolerans]|uniref:peptidoglycan DD-metalloendopeptidase family protein n=1 Tax=Shewanella psychrotolerans TaxID=2864206 RepID=UPI001C658172|nr:peptidoglycan DD-metalloendopeptidase family protein [Shewanella psychrotolerans]QYK03226.1 peptidoglycan DD-metalloendopeptidase family protein [Shewanella psychrotolerans]